VAAVQAETQAEPEQLAAKFRLECPAQLLGSDALARERIGPAHHLVRGSHVGDLDREYVGRASPLGPGDQERRTEILGGKAREFGSETLELGRTQALR